jgi:hypothetical protein
MFDLHHFIIDSHCKIIGHYKLLLATSRSDEERDRFKRMIEEHEQSLQRELEKLPAPRRAA